MKKILVLDIDETLLNMEPLFFLKKFKKNYKEYEGTMIFDKYYMSLRPKAKEFLKKAQEHFKLVAFSVVNKKITEQKLNKAGVLNHFSRVYGKESLVNGKKVLREIAKDLNKNLEDILIIEDKPKVVKEKDKTIAISPWFIGSSKNDNELIKILEFNTKILSLV